MLSIVERRIVSPILKQLKRGQSPDKLALSVACGVVIACCPLFGATTAFCLGASFILRLNHPTVQLVNYFSYPLQLALMIPFFRAGELLFGAPHQTLQLPEMLRLFRADWLAALKAYGLLALRGAVVWLFLAPPAIYAIYRALKPVLARLSRFRR